MATCAERSQNIATESCIKKLGELQITTTVFNTSPEKNYAFYSQESEEAYGSVYYQTPGGNNVIVTKVMRGVGTGKELIGGWQADNEFVGEVTRCLGVAVPNPHDDDDYENGLWRWW